ncbi:T9SS-dependent choice-of-anchor J family protein [Chitinophaga sp. GCM10012297]|uniref:Ig-like domain-containing protein n=1 Tax=Chitinophaga chungangae TaxID=2821488 RepID=A0ABS3Y7F2_9BACT|nr:choice-of-anchor J domain-containing protein [Chitinophaga chungangae]MBO9150602.1 Ig-like domain-containing protein [Chitinophaga chungangae]
MKKPLLLAILLCPLLVFAQGTQPAPQGLPYLQDFSALPHASTVYPEGWQGWALSGAPGSAFNVLPAAGDKNLAANNTASSTTNGVLNYNGKIGYLNSGSADNAVALSVSTAANTNVRVRYQVMTLRNPYDGNSNTRINEAALQYRVGTDGNFTTLPSTVYRNNTETQTTSGVTTPQQLVSVEALLPAECENQPVVQLRWVNRQISGAGSRPSFAIDSVAVWGLSGDDVSPVISSLQPANGTTGAVPGSNAVITFDENIRKNTGSVRVHDLGQGTQLTLNITDPRIIVSSNTLSIPAGLRGNREYYITLDSNAIQDSNGNGFAGIADSTGWRFATGDQLLDFPFTVCGNMLPDGFTQHNVTGAQTWTCTTFGQSGNGVQINGFSGGARENEDWLISPAFDLSGFNVPLLAFASRSAFQGPSLELRVSADYPGSGDPHGATWTSISGRFPEVGSDVWKTSSGINLSQFKGTDVYIAWVYTSSPAAQASRWTLDDIRISDTTAAPAPDVYALPSQLDFDYAPAGQRSAPQPFTYWASDLTAPLVIAAPANFEVSTDNIQYHSSVTIPAAEAVAALDSIWVRFAPSAANQNYNGNISFSSTGLQRNSVSLSGTSLRSLKVVNWNMEWFGHPQFGPTNEALQQTNALKVLKSLDADIYALVEVVDTVRLKAIVDSMPGYRYTVSDFGSRVDSITSPQYDSAQKLAFVYREDLVKNLRTYGVLRKNASADAYFNWSSGRFPYLMEAMVNLNGDSARIHFIVIHAKANTGDGPADYIESWHRRRNGAKELKDTLDAHFAYKNVLVLGDFNDDFDRTITAQMAPDTTTSYIDFKLDSLDYIPLTYALSLAKQRSTASFADMIDHAMGTNEMQYAYLPGSARVVRSVESLIPSYSNFTSDHFPILSRYDLRVLAHPVEITMFTARENDGGVELTWNTVREINNSHFVVERSLNGRNWQPVDTLAATAVNGQGAVYRGFDGSVLPGYWNYRLHQFGLDSTEQYSPVQSVLVLSRESWFRLLWFILGRQLYIYMDARESGPATMQLFDLQGIVRYQTKMNFYKGMNFRSVDVGNMASGIYLLRVQCGNKVEVKKIFINR